VREAAGTPRLVGGTGGGRCWSRSPDGFVLVRAVRGRSGVGAARDSAVSRSPGRSFRWANRRRLGRLGVDDRRGRNGAAISASSRERRPLLFGCRSAFPRFALLGAKRSVPLPSPLYRACITSSRSLSFSSLHIFCSAACTCGGGNRVDCYVGPRRIGAGWTHTTQMLAAHQPTDRYHHLVEAVPDAQRLLETRPSARPLLALVHRRRVTIAPHADIEPLAELLPVRSTCRIAITRS